MQSLITLVCNDQPLPFNLVIDEPGVVELFVLDDGLPAEVQCTITVRPSSQVKDGFGLPLEGSTSEFSTAMLPATVVTPLGLGVYPTKAFDAYSWPVAFAGDGAVASLQLCDIAFDEDEDAVRLCVGCTGRLPCGAVPGRVAPSC
jgi:hypothetical protein